MSEAALNLYTPDAFVNRKSEIETAQRCINEFRKDRSKPRATIFTGVRCVGKTWFALHLARTVIPEMRLPVFFISLLDVHEGGESGPGEWWPDTTIKDEDPKKATLKKEAAIGSLLDKIARCWNITEVKAGDLVHKSKYLQRDISNLSNSRTLVLIVDSAHESEEEFFRLLQRYVITPLTHTNRVFTIITGRGTPPTWDSPYLRTADAAKVVPFDKKNVDLQLKAPNLQFRLTDSETLANISGGYPGTVRLLVEANEDNLYDAIPGVLRKLLADVPTAQWNIVYEYLKRICVLKRPFRVSETEVLFERFSPPILSPSDVREAQNILLNINLMEWRRGGYELNESIKIPLQRYLQVKQPDNWTTYSNTVIKLFGDLVTQYKKEGHEDAVKHYKKLVDELSS